MSQPLLRRLLATDYIERTQMVAHQGRGWQLAQCLITLESEANKLAPTRNKASDGSIGDTAHASRTSDHNVDNGYCHALDLTHDPRNGFDAHLQAQGIASRHDPRIKYIISQRRIWYPNRGWIGYGGANPHDKHAHFSVWHTNIARNNLSPWGVASAIPPQPPPPSDEEEDVTKLLRFPDGKYWEVNSLFRKEVVGTKENLDMFTFLGAPPQNVSAAFAQWVVDNTVDANFINATAIYSQYTAEQVKKQWGT
jgi:hypothetical protein